MITLKFHFLRKNIIILSLCMQCCYALVVYRFYCMALFHSQTQRHIIITVLNYLSLDLTQKWNIVNDLKPPEVYI